MATAPQSNNVFEEIDDTIAYARKASFREAIALYSVLSTDPHWSDACKARMGRGDRYYLIAELCNRKDVVHPWLYERCREVEADPDEHLDLWARGHYKSTFITFGGIIQEILRDPEITIGLFSHTGGIAKAFLTQIKMEFERNLTLQRIYADVLYSNPQREAPRWSIGDGLIVKRQGNPKESTLDAWGLVDGQPTSKHYDLRVYDDVVTLESVATPDQIAKTTNAWELSQNLGKPGKSERRWHIGTRYNFGDTWQTLIDRSVVKQRIYPATHDGSFDGEPVFLSQAQWDKLKSDTSESTVACQQLQNPSAGSQQEFKPEWLRRYEIRPRTLNVYIMCDYAGARATGSKSSSNTAIAVVGVDGRLNKYLLDGYCHKLTLAERWVAIKLLRRKWLRQKGVQIVEVGYEKFGAQSDIEHFEEMMRIEGEFFDIKELAWPREGGVSKDTRIRRLQPDFKNWRMFLPYVGDPTRTQLDAMQKGDADLLSKAIKQKNQDGKIYDVVEWFIKNEYLYFPNTTHKDFLDALSRLYDMDIVPPMIYDQNVLEPEAYDD